MAQKPSLITHSRIRSSNCLLPAVSDAFTGTQEITDCSTDTGCNYIPGSADDPATYGDDFNAVGGGVYALQRTSTSIGVWHFPRSGIPQDIINKAPDPSRWGKPTALFGTSSCDISTHFTNMSIVVNTVSPPSLVP